MTVVDSISLGKTYIDFVKDGKYRKIQYAGKDYLNITSLVKDVPELKKEIISLAKTVNFLFQDYENEVIEDIEAFKMRYISEIAKEKGQKFSPDVPQYSTWGTYDVSNISLPHWENDKFIFYVWNFALQIPYKVILSPGTKEICEYKVLKPQ